MGAKFKLKSRSLSVLLSVGAVSALAMAACQSKFSELPPESVADSSVTLEARTKQHAEIQKLLGEAQRRVRAIQSLLVKMKLAKGASVDENAYTPLDLFLQLSEDLKKPLPQGAENEWTQESTSNLELPGLSPECRPVIARIVMKNSALQSRNKRLVSNAEGTLSLRSCKTAGQFVPLFQISRQNLTFEFRSNAEPLSELFTGLLPEKFELNAACVVSSREGGTNVNDMTCDHLPLVLNQNQLIMIDRLVYTNDAAIAIPVSAQGRLFENGSEKLQISFAMNRDGNVSTEVKSTTGAVVPPEATPAPLATPAAPMASPVPTPPALPSTTPAPTASPAPTPAGVDPVATPEPGGEAAVVDPELVLDGPAT